MNEATISLDEAADRLQSTPLNVLMHIKRELLSGEEIDGNWFVDTAALDALLAQREDSPSENLCQSSCAHKCPSCG